MVEPGGVAVRDISDEGSLKELAEKKVVGLITGGLHLKDFNDLQPEFSVVVIDGFGEKTLSPEIHRLFEEHNGRLVCLDPATQLRAGVQRPRVIIPENQ